MSAEVLKSIKNGTALFDTGINKTYSQRELQSIFASQYVNSGAFLDTPEQKRLYDVFDGNYTIKSKKPIKEAPYKPAHICKYENVMVYTDFPKGPSHSDTTYMWEDGTYDDMMASVHKQNDEVPGIFPINAPLRQTIMNLAEMTGGRLEDSIYKYKQTLTEDREQTLRAQLTEGGVSQSDIDNIIALQRAEEETAKKMSAGAFLTGRAKEEYTKLLAGRLQAGIEDERIWLGTSTDDSQGIRMLVANGENPETVEHLIAMARGGDRQAQIKLHTMIEAVKNLPKFDRDRYVPGSRIVVMRDNGVYPTNVPPRSETNPMPGGSIDSAGTYRLAPAMGGAGGESIAPKRRTSRKQSRRAHTEKQLQATKILGK